MIPSDIGAGHEVGEPLAESVDSYDEYPDDHEDVGKFEYADIIGEVMTAVGHYEPWACAEMDVSSLQPWDSEFANDYVEDKTGDLWVNLEVQGETRQNRALSHRQFHKGEFGRKSPFEANFFTESTWVAGYDPEDVAEFFEDMDENDVRKAWADAGFIKEYKIDIEGGETLDRANYGDPAWEDPRVLEAFDEAGYNIHQVAEYFNVSQSRIERECIKWKLTEAQQNGGGQGSQVPGYAGAPDGPRQTAANTHSR